MTALGLLSPLYLTPVLGPLLEGRLPNHHFNSTKLSAADFPSPPGRSRDLHVVGAKYSI